MEDFRSITVSKGKPLQIDNPTSYNLIGQGAQGAVFQLSSKRCVKIYLKNEDAIRENHVLKIVNDANSPFFPKVYETGSNYIVMEYIKGPTLSQYLSKKKRMPRWLTKQLVRMLREMKKLKFARLDASPRHIFVVNGERLQVIDHVNSFKKQIPYPREILAELESRKLKKGFLRQVKRSNPYLYQKWSKLQ
ncbi:AarF/UbiB family protein [Paenibacillus sp. GCM10027628]|uniref:AarF/UbiB family protein n=1 Tax=Paenibacillus sp. GCM10027628 TaxID=3273413 RepID=UPI003636CAA0